MTVPEDRTGPGNHQQVNTGKTEKENGGRCDLKYIQVNSIGQLLDILKNLDVLNKCRRQNLV